jgi:hypothetical protein
MHKMFTVASGLWAALFVVLMSGGCTSVVVEGDLGGASSGMGSAGGMGGGTCVSPDVNGTACNDGDACTQVDTCQDGVCVGMNTVTCSALDHCHLAGVCDSTTGVCSNPVQADGFACEEGDGCTQGDTCQDGVCVGGMACSANAVCVAGGCVCTGVVGRPGLPQPGVGNSPISVAVADLNGDGKPDLATANWFSDDVSVLLNQGNGTFAAAVNYGADSYPISVAAADLNGDGKPDLAVANRNSDHVSVLLNQGNGTFAAAVSYAAGTSPSSVAAADLNGDGKPDLAVANYNSDNVSILLTTCLP